MSRKKREPESWKQVANKPRWTEPEGKRVVEAWRTSGKPLEEFAAEHQIGPWRLSRWFSCLSQGTSSPKNTTRHTNGERPRLEATKSVKFVPAVVHVEPTATCVLIRLPDGIEVELRHDAGTTPGEVACLVAALRGV